MSWLFYSVATAVLWGTAELFYKKGARDDEKYSHLKICVWVGVVMGAHAIFTLLTQDINYPTNMLYAKTLRAVANLYGDASLAEKAAALKQTINEKAFTENGFYCDNAVYGEDGVAKLSGKCTETCQYYAFFCDITTPEEKPELWQRMLHDFGPERIVPNKWPEFTPDAKWKEIYPSNAFIGNYLRLELLDRYGEKEKLIENIRGFFTKMADLTGTLWENDSTTASCNHGFASHVLYWMDRMGMISD